MSPSYVLAIDEGSSSARTVLVNADGAIVAEARMAVHWNRPHPGWAELDPVALWDGQLDTIRRCVALAGIDASQIAACAVTTHRETVLIWDRATGKPVHDAVVWISHQTEEIVERWQAQGLDAEFRRRTGLRNDSYFSAGKLVWLLENVPGVRARAEAGELAAGTIDSWLVWNLTGGRSHLTDHSSASRTALFDLVNLRWDDQLCQLLDIPTSLLPPAVASDADFGVMDRSLLGAEIPIRAVVADQQASMYGQACFADGSSKKTFGTAGVMCLNTGSQPVLVHGLTSSVGWTAQGRTAYEMEGVIFHSGQTLSWMRDSMSLLAPGDDIAGIAGSVADSAGVYLVPGFGGLCAPYWDRKAKASITGMTLETTKAHIVRAALDSMAHQTVDILDVLAGSAQEVTDLRVDGGAAGNDLLCQLLADFAGLPIKRPTELERTALGVAFVAGTAVGLWNGPDDVTASWKLDRIFDPQLPVARRAELRSGWLQAVARTLSTTPQPRGGVGPSAAQSGKGKTP